MATTNPYARKRNLAASSSSDQQAPVGRRPSSSATSLATSISAAHTSRNDAAAPSASLMPPPSRLPAPNVPPLIAAATAATTFSQAFESIEETHIYQEQQQQLLNGRASLPRGGGDADDRAAQRALDRATAAAADSAVNVATTTTHAETASAAAFLNASIADQYPEMSDRDSHVLLQQPHVLYVSVKQRGNGVLNYIRNVPCQFQKMVPDYIFSSTTCALFLSIRYHLLYKEYIERRIAALRTDFTLRVLLVLVDVDDNQTVLLELNKLAVLANLTLILAWSEEEAARYLETFKALHGKDASSIQKNKENGTFADQVSDFLTTCKSINKTDAASVLTQFGSVRAALAATPDELALIAGLGEVKVKRLYDAFHKPFSSKTARLRKAKQLENTVAASTRREGKESDNE